MATSTIKSNKKYGNITASNGCAANEVSVVQEGSLICIKCWFNKSAGIGTAEIEVGTLSGVDLPNGIVRFSVGAGNQAYALTDLGYGAITPAGEIRVKLATSRPNIVMNVVYSI